MPSLPIADLAESLMRRNTALLRNRPIANNNITEHGSNLDWAICALHALLLLVVVAWNYSTKPRRRVFHYFAITILTVTTIYYFIMASNLGGHAVLVQFRGGNILRRTRQVFYTRWVGYFINFSLIFFALLLMSGVGWATILFTIGLVMLWASMFLTGMFVRSAYKWGFFVIGYVLYFLIVWHTMGTARSHAGTINANTHRTFTTLAGWTLFLMLLYPIAWALSEGGNRITNDSEQIFYSVLDVLSQGVFSIMLLALTRTLDLDELDLGFTESGRVGRQSHQEKHDRSIDANRPRAQNDAAAAQAAAGTSSRDDPATATAAGAL